MIATDSNFFAQEHAQFFERPAVKRPDWLSNLQRSGIRRFSEAGLPTKRDEEWRFTNLSALGRHRFRLAERQNQPFERAEEFAKQAVGIEEDCHRLVFLNGHYVKTLSEADALSNELIVDSLGLSIQRNAAAVEAQLGRALPIAESPFAALNQAFVEDGAHIVVPSGCELSRPIHLLFLWLADEPLVYHPRNAIRLGKNARATIVESHLGSPDSVYFSNVVTQIELGEGAELDHHKLQQESPAAVHMASTCVSQQAGSCFQSHYFSFGGSLARNELSCRLDGQEAQCTLNGLYMPSGQQLMDCRTRIDHLRPNCRSFELYKGILNDHAKGVFNGKIHVHQDAQKTDAKQSNQALLLSDEATIDTMPQLEIYADDVRCTHGATVGELDAQALGYLRSRGIPRELARTMLIFAFANDVVQSVRVPSVRQRLESLLLAERGLPNI
jgi:Fe-S cluster assembly protein SufD